MSIRIYAMAMAAAAINSAAVSGDVRETPGISPKIKPRLILYPASAAGVCAQLCPSGAIKVEGGEDI